MTYANILEYAGGTPYEPERERDDITWREREMLEQDEPYRRLAQIRYLCGRLEDDMRLHRDVPDEVWREVFDATYADDAPIQEAVDKYVEFWLEEYRSRTDDDHADAPPAEGD